MAKGLEPCRFCGSLQVEIKYIEKANSFWIKCLSCKAEGPLKGTPEDAINAWNTRRPISAEDVREAAQAVDDLRDAHNPSRPDSQYLVTATLRVLGIEVEDDA